MKHCKTVDPKCYVVGEVWESFTNYTKYYSSGIDSVFGFTMAQESGKIAKTINGKGADNSVKSFAQAMVTVEQKLASYSLHTDHLIWSGRKTVLPMCRHSLQTRIPY